jgi:hypothetical protein
MKLFRIYGTLIVAGVLILCCVASAGAASEARGYYAVHSNADGAHVLFDNVYKGDIRGGTFTYTLVNGSESPRYVTVELVPYGTHSVSIDQVPSNGQTIDITVPLDTTLGTFLICSVIALAILIAALIIFLAKRRQEKKDAA